MKIFCHHHNFNFIKEHVEVALQYLFNVVVLLNTAFHLKQKIDPKVCTFNNLGEFQKTWRKFLKN